MDLEDIRKAQEELVRESQDYFQDYYDWEQEAQEKFLASTWSREDED